MLKAEREAVELERAVNKMRWQSMGDRLLGIQRIDEHMCDDD